MSDNPKRQKSTKLSGSLYCRPKFRCQPLQGRTSPNWCPECGFRIRSENHKEGKHHQLKHPSKRRDMVTSTGMPIKVRFN